MPKTVEKKRKWGHEKGWRWTTREKLELRCMRHRRIIVQRIRCGRRVTVVEDRMCKRRAIIRRSGKRKLSRENMTRLRVTIDVRPMELKP